MENRKGAIFCRRCRAELLPGELNLRDADQIEASFIRVAGDFRRGPLFLHGAAYALTADGSLVGVSLREGAKIRVLGEMDRAAAFNKAALVKVLPKGTTQPGWTYLGVSPQRVEAVSLVTGEKKVLYEASSGAEIAVNPAGSGAGFRGVAATGYLYAFAEQAGSEQISLVVCTFSGKVPPERPLTIDGTAAMGPALADEALVLCSAEMVGVYDLHSRSALQMKLPAQFSPLLVRRQGSLNVPVGSQPLTIVRGAAGLEAWIGGEYGNAGVLVVELETKRSRFERAPREATLSSNVDGSLCLAAEDEVHVIGTKNWKSQKISFGAGMPAIVSEGFLLTLAETGRSGRHILNLSQQGRGTAGSLTFEDMQFLAETVCGAAVMGDDIAVAYLPGGSGKGFTVAHWHVEQAIEARLS